MPLFCRYEPGYGFRWLVEEQDEVYVIRRVERSLAPKRKGTTNDIKSPQDKHQNRTLE